MIKNLLFDLGGVIVDLCPERAVKSFEDVGLADAGKLLDPYAQTGVFLQLEEGKITPEQFYERLRQHATRPVTDRELDEAFFSFIKGLPVRRLQALRQLRKRYKVYALSNTNRIMVDKMASRLFAQEGREMADYFDGMVLSYEVGVCKPDAEIFRIAIRQLGILPEETLFFDDSQANVDVARKLGFKAVRV